MQQNLSHEKAKAAKQRTPQQAAAGLKKSANAVGVGHINSPSTGAGVVWGADAAEEALDDGEDDGDP